MKRFGIIFMFLLMNAIALVIGVSCSNQTPNSAFIAPVQTVAGSNPSFTPTPTFTFTVTPTPTIPYPAFVSVPYALAIDSTGRQYVGSTGSNLIYQYVGGVLNSAWPNGKTKSSGLTLTAPKAITTDPSGNLYVVGSGNAVRKYDDNGTFQVQFTPFMSNPQGLACAGTTIYASDTGNQKIIRFIQPGTAGTTIVDTSVSPIYSPYGIASNSAGTTIFVAGSDNYVHVYTSTGTPTGPVSIGIFNAPYDVALDSNKNLFVSDTGNHQIEEFTFGNYVSPAEILGSGTLSSPEGIAVDASNNVYVVDSANNLFYQFTP
jgi:tripartite motif-containing protein 71